MARIKDGYNFIKFKYAIIDKYGNLAVTSNYYFDDKDFKSQFKNDKVQDFLRLVDTAKYVEWK